jgi:uncharacterized protein (TIGR03083 family)
MALPRDQVTRGLIAELESFEGLIRSVDDEGWAAPSRCAGWSVGDVAAHLIGGMTDVVNLRLEGLGTPEVTEREVVERRGLSPAQLADELAADIKLATDLLAAFDDTAWAGPAPGGFDFTLGEGIEALWADAYVHADDIRTAIGRPSQPGGEGLLASVSHVADTLTRQGWGPATLALTGLPEFPVGDGSGRRVTGEPLAFVLAATGRADPAPLGLDESVNIYR